MKIAIIAHSLHPVKEPFEGGLEMITFLLCESLLNLGLIVHLYAHKNSDTRFIVHPLGDETAITSSLDAQASSVDLSLLGNPSEVFAYTKAMMEIAQAGYDIVHNHSLHYIPIILGNKLKIPMITSIHTPQFEFLKLGARLVKANCNQTFTMVSKSLAHTWENCIPKATVVYNGINIATWDYVAAPTGNYVFWYGRICPEKGTDAAIKGALASGVPIVLAGPISNKTYFETSVVPYLNNDNVRYVGHKSQKELAPLLQNAKAFPFTSTWDEPYGLTLAESLACGTPVVAFEGGATGEILTPKCGIIVPKGAIFELATAITKASNLDRSECRERAVSFCSHKGMVEEYMQLYTSLIQDPASQMLRKIS